MTNALLVTDSANLAPYVHRYLSGEPIASIAESLGITPQAFYLRMRRWSLIETGDTVAYTQLITESLVNRVAEGDLKLEFAASSVEVARAREIARFARMDLERRRPEIYGEKKEVKEDKTIRVIIQRDNKPEPRVIESDSSSAD